MAGEDEYKKINEKLKTLLQELLNTGNWEATLFLRTTSKKLKDIYQKAEALSKAFDLGPSIDIHASKVEQGLVKVYVSLYQSDSYNLQKWQNTLKNIREYSINRPIYGSKEHVEEMIRSKQGSSNEAYVIIFIEKDNIIPPYVGKKVQDRWGHELLTLRDNSLLPENIVEFVHQSRHYTFENGKLSLKSDNNNN